MMEAARRLNSRIAKDELAYHGVRRTFGRTSGVRSTVMEISADQGQGYPAAVFELLELGSVAIADEGSEEKINV